MATIYVNNNYIVQSGDGVEQATVPIISSYYTETEAQWEIFNSYVPFKSVIRVVKADIADYDDIDGNPYSDATFTEFLRTNTSLKKKDVDAGLNLDAFNRLRISSPQTVFDSKQIYDNQPLFWDDSQVSGSGTTSTHSTLTASTTLSVSNLTAGKRIRQTFRSFNYQTGKSQLVLLTGIIENPATGITRRIGQFNDDNGYMVLSTPTSLAVGIRSKTSGFVDDNIVEQADWNLDTLDGTGASGITLDASKTQIFFFDYQWLGVGAVRFGVVIEGVSIYIHQFNHANILTNVYTSTPNLPLRYEIENDGTGAVAELKQICSTVITEGGRQDTGVIRGLNRDNTTLTTGNNLNTYGLIGVRLKTAYLGAFVRYLDHQIICNSTAEYAWYVILKPTITGTAPTWNALANSSLEFAYPTNATTFTGGTIIASGIGSDGNQTRFGSQGLIQSDLTIGSSIAGVSDEVFLCVKRLTGTTETFFACMNISETF